MKPNNLYLKQLISEIAKKANEGRTDLHWGVLSEGKKKKKVVEAKDEKSSEDDTEGDLPALGGDEKGGDEGGADLPDLGGGDSGGEGGDEQGGGDEGGLPDIGGGDGEDVGGDEPSDEDVSAAKEDAIEKKAELEKAKAEKDQAEQEIEKNSYVKLGSTGGVHYLLGKIVDHAFKTNSIDSLASEMVQKLKIQTPEDMATFAQDVAPFNVIPGMGELLASMKGMATKQQKTPEPSDETES